MERLFPQISMQAQSEREQIWVANLDHCQPGAELRLDSSSYCIMCTLSLFYLSVSLSLFSPCVVTSNCLSAFLRTLYKQCFSNYRVLTCFVGAGASVGSASPLILLMGLGSSDIAHHP